MRKIRKAARPDPSPKLRSKRPHVRHSSEGATAGSKDSSARMVRQAHHERV